MLGNIQTAQRSSDKNTSDNIVFQRHLVAYEKALEMISGEVIELGCGEGYGARLLAPKASRYLAVDKFQNPGLQNVDNIEFHQLKLPLLQDIPDNSFDFAVSFQVIEHIRNDGLFISEIKRVLKPGASLILTTPNIRMSLTRNPWHVREYTLEQITALMGKYFQDAVIQGVFGNTKVMAYHEENKRSVSKITRFDVFRMQYWLPAFLLRIPYDLLNSINRKRLLSTDKNLVTGVTSSDFYLTQAINTCLDFFVIATKTR